MIQHYDQPNIRSTRRRMKQLGHLDLPLDDLGVDNGADRERNERGLFVGLHLLTIVCWASQARTCL